MSPDEVHAPKVAYCHGNKCKKPRNFQYEGPQVAGGMRLFDYYSCPVCETTRAFDHSDFWTNRMNLPGALEALFKNSVMIKTPKVGKK